MPRATFRDGGERSRSTGKVRGDRECGGKSCFVQVHRKADQDNGTILPMPGKIRRVLQHINAVCVESVQASVYDSETGRERGVRYPGLEEIYRIPMGEGILLQDVARKLKNAGFHGEPCWDCGRELAPAGAGSDIGLRAKAAAAQRAKAKVSLSSGIAPIELLHRLFGSRFPVSMLPALPYGRCEDTGRVSPTDDWRWDKDQWHDLCSRYSGFAEVWYAVCDMAAAAAADRFDLINQNLMAYATMACVGNNRIDGPGNLAHGDGIDGLTVAFLQAHNNGVRADADRMVWDGSDEQVAARLLSVMLSWVEAEVRPNLKTQGGFAPKGAKSSMPTDYTPEEYRPEVKEEIRSRREPLPDRRSEKRSDVVKDIVPVLTRPSIVKVAEARDWFATSDYCECSEEVFQHFLTIWLSNDRR